MLGDIKRTYGPPDALFVFGLCYKSLAGIVYDVFTGECENKEQINVQSVFPSRRLRYLT
jgi:hypothetical protein